MNQISVVAAVDAATKLGLRGDKKFQVAMDTLNDGSLGTYKTVLPLYHVGETAPWTWHGWQTDLREAMRKSITSTMIGSMPSDEDVEAMVAYLKTLEPPPNPFRGPGDSCSDAAERGREIFLSERANCAACHNGPSMRIP